MGNREHARDVDIEAFRRWVDEGDVHTYAQEAGAVLAEDNKARAKLNSLLVYGAKL